MNKGDWVIFLGASKEQISWGSNDDPNLVCKVEEVYQIQEIEIHSFHTKITLVGIEGKFNSVSFELASPIFYISGYWKDDKSAITDCKVIEFDDDFEDDDTIFFYGLSESEIQDAISKGEDTVHDFVITSYHK